MSQFQYYISPISGSVFNAKSEIIFGTVWADHVPDPIFSYFRTVWGDHVPDTIFSISSLNISSSVYNTKSEIIFGTVWADHVPDPIFSITSLNISCFLLAFSTHAASARQQGLFCINWRDYVTSATTQKKSLKSTFCSSSTSQPPHSKKTYFLHFTSQYRSMISTAKILSLQWHRPYHHQQLPIYCIPFIQFPELFFEKMRDDTSRGTISLCSITLTFLN